MPAALSAVRAAEADHDLGYALEKARPAVQRSLDGLARVNTIVRSLKQFAHPDGLEKSNADLNQAIQNTLIIASNEYKYVADLVCEFAELPLVSCHLGDINQVVLLLLINAARAISIAVQGTSDRGTITVRTRIEGDQIGISVQDTGIGIPARLRDSLFAPGEGLSVARAMVEKHLGSLDFESTLGQGATFSIRLPHQLEQGLATAA